MMKITKKMSDNAFKYIEKVYGGEQGEYASYYKFNESNLDNTYVRLWFVGSLEKLYNIKLFNNDTDIPSIDDIKNLME